MAFECRREELARESAVEPGQVGDAAVVESFQAQIEPGGAMLDYLEAGDLAVVIGDVLFVHGGFRPETCGKCPPGAGSAETVADWVSALNAFKVLLLLLLLLILLLLLLIITWTLALILPVVVIPTRDRPAQLWRRCRWKKRPRTRIILGPICESPRRRNASFVP